MAVYVEARERSLWSADEEYALNWEQQSEIPLASILENGGRVEKDEEANVREQLINTRNFQFGPYKEQSVLPYDIAT